MTSGIATQHPPQPIGPRMPARMPIGVKGGLGYESAGGSHSIGFYLLAMFTFLSFSRIADFTVYYLHLPLIISTCALGFCVLTRGVERAMQTRVGLMLIGFTGWILMGLPFSQWRSGTWGLFSSMWIKSLLAYFLVAGLILTVRDARGIMNTLAVSSVMIVLIARIFRQVGADGRLTVMGNSTISNPNDLAQLLLVGLPFLYLIFTTSNMAGKIFALVSMPLVAYTISATGSRGALVAIVVMAGYIFWGASMGGKIKGIVLGMMFVVAIVALVPGQLKDRYRTIFSSDAGTESDYIAVESREQRWLLLKQSIKFTITHPLFGVGAGQFVVASKNDMNDQGRGAMWRESHNAYTQVSSETGLPGFFMYFGCLFIAFRLMTRLKRATRDLPRYRRLYQTAYCMYLSLLSFAVTSAFSSVAYQHYLPSLLGLAVALYQAAAYELGVAGIPMQPAMTSLLPPLRRRPNPAQMDVPLGPLAPARRG